MPGRDIILDDGTIIPFSELDFRSSRSGGPGGQNVNKVESKIELTFDVKNSRSLTDGQRSRMIESLRTRIDSDGVLHISSQVSRSQWENREAVVAKFASLVQSALRRRKKRIATKPTRAAREKRLLKKRIKSEKKKIRSGRGIE